jgi:hypothetical protein
VRVEAGFALVVSETWTNPSIEGLFMMPFSAESALPYPTPYMQRLFSSLAIELHYLEALVGSDSLSSGAAEHGKKIATLRALLAANYSGLAFFLAHPTQRLSVILLEAAKEAGTAAAWLLDHRSRQLALPGFEQLYLACCERIRAGISDWQQSVDLQRMMAELDGWQPETVH